MLAALVWLAAKAVGVDERESDLGTVVGTAEPPMSGDSQPVPTPAALAVPHPTAARPFRSSGPIEMLASEPPSASQPTHGLMVHVVDEMGVGVSGIRVLAVRPEDIAKAVTDAEGLGWLDCTPGDYQVTAFDKRAEGRYAGDVLESVLVSEESLSQATLTMCTATCRVEALVSDESGSPLDGVGLDGNGRAPTRAKGLRVTDSTGIATWDPVAAGPWTVKVLSDNSTAAVIVPETPFTVTAEPGQTVRLPISLVRHGLLVVGLSQVSQLHGLVGVSAMSGTEFEHRGLESVTVGTTGELELTFTLPPGEYAVVTDWRPGSTWWSRPERVTVRPGETTRTTIDPTEARVRLTGRIHDAAGTGVAGVGISASAGFSEMGDLLDRAPDYLVMRSAQSDAHGNWAISVPWEGSRVRIRPETAVGRHLAADTGIVEVTDSSIPIDIVVEPGCILKGQLAGRWAQTLTDSTLELVLEHETSGPFDGGRSVPVSAGSFEILHARAGAYTATLRLNDERVSSPVRFVVQGGFREGETIPLQLTFPD
jgi:hypothetical protein